jgi:hypothetical protein
MFPEAHKACWNAGWVLTKVVRPTARPTLATDASNRKWWGKKGARNSHVTHVVKNIDVEKRKRCKGGTRKDTTSGIQAAILYMFSRQKVHKQRSKKPNVSNKVVTKCSNAAA